VSELSAQGRYIFRDAVPADDPILREILRATPLPGWATLGYEREPNYFQGCLIEGDTRIILASTADGNPVGFFTRAVRTVWIAGRPVRLGYLGQLRLLAHWRGRSRIILRGFQLCRQLLADGRQQTPYYLTSILSDNSLAHRILTSGIKGMPTYLPLGSFITLLASTHQPLARRLSALPYTLRSATEADIDTIAALLQSYGSQYALHPYWDADNLRALRSVGWRAENSILLLKNDQPVACASVWDQRAVRQQRIIAYSPTLHYTRPAISAALRFAGFPHLPPPGELLNQGFLSHMAITPGEEMALPTLVAGLLRLAKERGLSSVVMGLSEKHPWFSFLTKLRALRYRSQLYLVHWPEGQAAAKALLGQPMQTEVACL